MEMGRQEALEILGLEPGASADEIDQRFRVLASETHPDHGGSTERFSDVVAARDLLKSEATGARLVHLQGPGTALTAPAHLDLVSLEKERDSARQRQQNSERVAKGLVRAEVSRLTRSKRRASFLAWLGGGAGIATLALRGTGSTAESFIGFPWVAPVLVISVAVGAICAIASFAISDQISRIEQAIEDAAETMVSRSTFLDLLYEIVESGQIDDQNAWTSNELEEAVSWWSQWNSQGTEWRQTTRRGAVGRLVRFATIPSIALRRIARWSISGRFDPTPSLADLAEVIGAKGFVRLLIAKGEEIHLLVVEEEVVEGRLFVRHRLALEGAGVTS